MPGTVRLLVQLQHPAPMGKSPNTPRPGALNRQGSLQHMAAGKTAQVPVMDSSTKGGLASASTGLYGVLTERTSGTESGRKKEKDLKV